MCNKSNLGDQCYVCNISSNTDRILETSTYLTGGISLPKVFPTQDFIQGYNGIQQDNQSLQRLA